MADKKNPRRPVAGSRIPARSPKRLAGQPARPEPADAEPADAVPAGAVPVDAVSADESIGAENAPEEHTAPLVPEYDSDQDQSGSDQDHSGSTSQRRGVLQRAKTTVVLGVMVAVAAVLLGLLALLQSQEPNAEDSVAVWTPVGRAGEFSLPASGEVPVTVDSLEWTSAVDEIAHSVTKLLSFDHETIDAQEELAEELVTSEFLEEEFRGTIEETAPKLKKNEAEYVVTVAGQSVISATPTRVRALLFVNQLVTKGSGKDVVSDNYPLRLDVEGVLVDGTWLISSLNAG